MSAKDDSVKVIGAGLAGCEAAWQLAQRGISVTLYEMKPIKRSPAHHSDNFAELVCSNSLKTDAVTNAAGLLKEEMRRLNSLIMQCADATKVPAGQSLAVDREAFSQTVTDKITAHPLIDIVHEDVDDINPDTNTIIATGPLTSDGLADAIKRLTGTDDLYFYDAAAPLVSFDSIDKDNAFFASRYGKGTPDYLNCPMTKEQYDLFYTELINAETAPLKTFEHQKVFEGCMPVEVMAKRGENTLLFGPLKPVGLVNPKTGADDAYAVVQLRKDNAAGDLYNMVGFQTNLKWPEQKRVFSMIPALKNADFVRYGVMHRNSFINSPKLLNCHYQMLSCPKVFFAGQITGVEGYVESVSSGLMAGLNMYRYIKQQPLIQPDPKTAIGALALYISNPSVTDFQPMGMNFGIIEGWPERIKGKGAKTEKYRLIAERALDIIDNIQIS